MEQLSVVAVGPEKHGLNFTFPENALSLKEHVVFNILNQME
jgi:hypothetical protein